MKFAPIVPTAYMSAVNNARHANGSLHLILAHLCLKSEEYVNRAIEAPGRKILDNSFFELGYSLDTDTLLRIAEKVRADAIVLEDDTLKGYDKFYREGYDCYLTPHLAETLAKFAKLAAKDACTYLCISHIAAKKIVGGKSFGVSNRVKVLKLLQNLVFAEEWEVLKNGRLHFLGLGDSPQIELAKIRSVMGSDFTCDSSMFLYPFIKSGGEMHFEDIALKSKAESIDFDFKSRGGTFDLRVGDEIRRLTNKLA